MRNRKIGKRGEWERVERMENFKKSVKIAHTHDGGAKTINLRLKWPMTSFFSFKYSQKK